MTDQVYEELDKVIQKAAIDGTLSERAVKQFTRTIEANAELKKQLKTSEEQRTKGEEVLRLVQQERDDARKVRDVLLAKEQDMNDRIAQDEVLQLSVKYEQMRVEDHKNMVSLVFRNTVLKKGVMTAVNAVEPNQYNSCPSQGYPQHDTVEETEE